MGEDNMVERVARAIRAGRGCEHEFPCPFCRWGPDELTAQFDETGCIWLARAAIEAMKTPDDDMKIAGAAVLHRTALSSRESAASWTFQAMIDTALA